MGEDGARASWLQLLREKEEAARVSPGSLRKPETIVCFCLISQIESYKYLYVSLIVIIIK